ncbi:MULTISPECIES: hypothetical protein [unclassified Clostridium]|uniref:hypothetical protein n=1 Tax=unclassified Clostridium TaxID=2614128 RepID=UPI0025BB6AEB|nr:MULTISPECIES: hypothetical protein [unclassified Clostridium]
MPREDHLLEIFKREKEYQLKKYLNTTNEKERESIKKKINFVENELYGLWYKYDIK